MKIKIGWTCGAFDLLHAGHIELLKDCKNHCDYLIVGLHTDPSIDRSYKNKPIQTVKERYIMLRAVKYVDEIMTYHTEDDLHMLLDAVSPDIRINGADWRGKEHTGDDLNIEQYFHRRNHNWSSSELRKRIYEAERSK